jgi:hypothetical protein
MAFWNKKPLEKSLGLILNKRPSMYQKKMVSLYESYELYRKNARNAGVHVFNNNKITMIEPMTSKDIFIHNASLKNENQESQLFFWLDSLFHNCTGSLEALSHILNYVYDLKFEEDKVCFKVVAEQAEREKVGIYKVLNDIRNDLWFTLVTNLGNPSSHGVPYSIDFKFSKDKNYSEGVIEFPIDPTQGNLSHKTLKLFLNAGYTFKRASMDIDEFTNFVMYRLEEYLSQVDDIMINDCIDISKGRSPRSNENPPTLHISGRELKSWRNITEII